MKLSLKDYRLPVAYNPNQASFLQVVLLLCKPSRIHSPLISTATLTHSSPSFLSAAANHCLLPNYLAWNDPNLQMEIFPCYFSLKSPQQLSLSFFFYCKIRIFLNSSHRPSLFGLILYHLSPLFPLVQVFVPGILPELLHTLQVSAQRSLTQSSSPQCLFPGSDSQDVVSVFMTTV